MTESLLFEWDLPQLAEAMHLSEDEVVAYFTDGRRISFILERRIRDALGWTLAPSEGSGFDLIDEQGRNWEVRSVTRGIYFCPSYMIGSGRKFDEPGFITKLDSIAGYVCSDIRKFPRVPVWMVPCNLIRNLYYAARLGAGTRISSASFYSVIVPLLDTPTKVND